MSKKIELSKQGKNRGKYVAIVDDDDFDRVNKYRWSAMPVCRTIYAARYDRTKIVTMHSFIIGSIETGLEIDHIDGNGLNNTNDNLRVTTRQENAMNRKMKINSKSGYKGVSWNKRTSKWCATIGIDGKNIFVGYYSNVIDAARAYNEAALKYHGEFARLNVIPD